ncbi:hypothetical protein ENBRE01_2420 [Enteropsectra breve]|nr:hypothetical protein ENBRE01_2420 [Enteropsectra breve]
MPWRQNLCTTQEQKKSCGEVDREENLDSIILNRVETQNMSVELLAQGLKPINQLNDCRKAVFTVRLQNYPANYLYKLKTPTKISNIKINLQKNIRRFIAITHDSELFRESDRKPAVINSVPGHRILFTLKKASSCLDFHLVALNKIYSYELFRQNPRSNKILQHAEKDVPMWTKIVLDALKGMKINPLDAAKVITLWNTLCLQMSLLKRMILKCKSKLSTAVTENQVPDKIITPFSRKNSLVSVLNISNGDSARSTSLMPSRLVSKLYICNNFCPRDMRKNFKTQDEEKIICISSSEDNGPALANNGEEPVPLVIGDSEDSTPINISKAKEEENVNNAAVTAPKPKRGRPPKKTTAPATQVKNVVTPATQATNVVTPFTLVKGATPVTQVKNVVTPATQATNAQPIEQQEARVQSNTAFVEELIKAQKEKAEDVKPATANLAKSENMDNKATKTIEEKPKSIDVSDKPYRLVFKNDDFELEFYFKADDSIEEVYDKLFGDEYGRKLMCEGSFISRHLSVEENGFFKGTNYLTLWDGDNKPLAVLYSVTVNVFGNDAVSRTLSMSQKENVSAIFAKLDPQCGNMKVLYNGKMLDGALPLDTCIAKNSTLDLVPAEMLLKYKK